MESYSKKIAQALFDAGLDEMECSLVVDYIENTPVGGELS